MKTIKLSDLEEKINLNNEKYAHVIEKFKKKLESRKKSEFSSLSSKASKQSSDFKRRSWESD